LFTEAKSSLQIIKLYFTLILLYLGVTVPVDSRADDSVSEAGLDSPADADEVCSSSADGGEEADGENDGAQGDDGEASYEGGAAEDGGDGDPAPGSSPYNAEAVPIISSASSSDNGSKMVFIFFLWTFLDK
jgi:hypothetical protein